MFKEMKLATRLALSYGVIIFLMVIMGGISHLGLKKINNAVEVLVTDKWPKTVQANAMIGEVNVVARALRNMLLTDDKTVMQKERSRVIEATAAINKHYDELEKTVTSEKGRMLLKTLQDARAKYEAEMTHVLSVIDAGDKKLRQACFSASIVSCRPHTWRHRQRSSGTRAVKWTGSAKRRWRPMGKFPCLSMFFWPSASLGGSDRLAGDEKHHQAHSTGG